jgi:release factor glutamine methyltransferase
VTEAGTVAEALSSATAAFDAAGVDSPHLDAELLLAEATARTREQLAIDPDAPVSGPQGRHFGALVRRRVAREPVAYILGHRGFRNIDLQTDRRTLIPRPETELLVEVALELEPSRILDVGTGSGAIALALADEMPAAEVVAVDVSEEALTVAEANARALGFVDRVGFRLGSAPSAAADGPFDLVVANLPYIPDSDRRMLAPEITRYEPDVALFSGSDGLDAIGELLVDLAPGGAGPDCGAVALEIGQGQGEDVRRLIGAAGFDRVELRPDLAGIDRVVLGRR